MKRKFLSKTYLRDIQQYIIKFYFERNYCVCVKKFIKVKAPFISRHGYLLIDNNFQMVEIMPCNENYLMRVYLNEAGEVLERYFDITKQNAIDPLTNLPYYDDLYLDVVEEKCGIVIHDEIELDQALQSGDISKADYITAISTKNKLLHEIENKTNKLLKINLKNYLFS